MENLEEILAAFDPDSHTSIRTPSCWWLNQYGRQLIFYPFPIHRIVQPPRSEVEELFKKVRGLRAVRFLSKEGAPSFIWVCKKPYDLMQLSSNTRSKIRRGLKNVTIRKINADELLVLGAEANRDTFKRHGDTHDSSFLAGQCKILSKCPAYEAWGAFVDGQLASYVLVLSVEDWIYILVNRSISAYLKYYPNNALIFSVIQNFLSRPGISTVSYGWGSLSALDLSHGVSMLPMGNLINTRQ